MFLNARHPLLVLLLALSLTLHIGCGESEPGSLANGDDENQSADNDDPNQNNDDPNQNNDDPNQNNDDPNQNNDDPNQNNDDPNQNNDDPNQNNDDPNQNNGEPEPTGPVVDGEACESDGDCLGDLCLNGNDWPDGYCTTVACENYQDCANETDENACLLNPQGDNLCVRLCDPNASGDCREGYQCQPLEGGEGWCAPDPDGTDPEPGPDPDPGDPTETSFDGDCINVSGGQAAIDYEIDADTDQYTIIPYTQNGQSLWPSSISTPSTNISFNGENSFQAMGSQMFGYVNPTVIPAAPQFDYQMTSGSHTFNLGTESSEICYSLIQSSGTPTEIDLNIYLVGVPGIDASNAATQPDMQAVIDGAEEIYQQAGISFGEINYLSVSSQVEQQYQDIYSEQDISSLAAESSSPGSTADDALSANVFITRSFQMGGALGLSLGIPGVPGWHGTGLSGVAMTGEDIGGSWGGNELTAAVLAHELGHFLGLFHTTEMGGQTLNPLEDIEQCPNPQNATSCPDWGNLMFPAADHSNDELSYDQSFVLQVNPLTK